MAVSMLLERNILCVYTTLTVFIHYHRTMEGLKREVRDVPKERNFLENVLREKTGDFRFEVRQQVLNETRALRAFREAMNTKKKYSVDVQHIIAQETDDLRQGPVSRMKQEYKRYLSEIPFWMGKLEQLLQDIFFLSQKLEQAREQGFTGASRMEVQNMTRMHIELGKRLSPLLDALSKRAEDLKNFYGRQQELWGNAPHSELKEYFEDLEECNKDLSVMHRLAKEVHLEKNSPLLRELRGAEKTE